MRLTIIVITARCGYNSLRFLRSHYCISMNIMPSLRVYLPVVISLFI